MKKTGFFLPVAVGILLLFPFFSCTTKDKSDKIIKQMEESLINSNKAITRSTETTMKALYDKTTDQSYSKERSKLWYDIGTNIIEVSQNQYKFIDSLKKIETVSNAGVDLLYEKLLSYKLSILSIDSSIWYEFKDNFIFVHTFLKSTGLDTSNSHSISAKAISKSVLSALLTALQNNIKINENKITAFCNAKVGIIGDWFYSYSAIVGQNSRYLKPGDELEITAGVGAYSKSAKPVINVNGKHTEVGEEGYALYKMKINDKPGQYKIPVKIYFFNQTTGKDESSITNVEYTVAKPCDQ